MCEAKTGKVRLLLIMYGCFISSMNHCLQYFGGVPQTIVTDNLKSAVTKSSKYSAILNKSLKDMALHYKTSINPTKEGFYLAILKRSGVASLASVYIKQPFIIL